MNRTVACLALQGLALLFLAPPAAAATGPKAPTGNYALDEASCRGKDYFLKLSAKEIHLPVFSCKGLAFDLVQDKAGTRLWQVDGTLCQGEHAGRPGPKRFRMEENATSLRIFWPDGTRSSAFLKCGK